MCVCVGGGGGGGDLFTYFRGIGKELFHIIHMGGGGGGIPYTNRVNQRSFV